ncbi:hypothetical protein BGZ51_008805 [Haplosporangium sp. Z 767]|nr:hypothetical protein BGZ50_008956 [Haplosporangium sp. Z 11]KAF9177410.1 hypothetical protein BGZ51_008805 [Haplosporangium sp. Z 767]
MNTRIPTAWMEMILVRRTTRLVGDNKIKQETFGLWDEHNIKLLVGAKSPSSIHCENYISCLNIGDRLKVKGILRIKGLKISLVVKEVEAVNIESKESLPEQEDSSSEGPNFEEPSSGNESSDFGEMSTSRNQSGQITTGLPFPSGRVQVTSAWI